MKVSVIVPVYNEEENIEPLAREFAALTTALPELEVIVVDDGSSDATPERLAAAQKECAVLRAIRYEPNRGQSHAMLVGLYRATGEVMVTIDGDLQNDPADISKLVALVGEYDVVCGYRANRKDTWARRAGSRIANRVRNLVTHDGIRDTGCSLKAFKKACVADLPPVRGVHRFMPAYFRLNGRSITEVPVNHRARTRGVSKYTNLRRLPGTIRDLVGFAWYRARYLRPLPGNEVIDSRA